MRGRLDFKQRCIGGDKPRSVDVESIDFSGVNDNGCAGVAIG
jgi:hypothetical protein